MKPFITPEVSATGKKVLAFQCEGAEAGEIWNAIRGHSAVGYAMPSGHSFRAAWVFRLILNDGTSLEFSSAATEVVAWQEVGSLNVRLVEPSIADMPNEIIQLPTIAIPSFPLMVLEKLVYEDADVVAECGLVLQGEPDEEIVIAAGIPPGSVSVRAPFAGNTFEPQFPLGVCRRERLWSVGAHPILPRPTR